ncbi:MAG: FAD-dependent oxidoreductase, partial [Gammaproteobacteria bacterium]
VNIGLLQRYSVDQAFSQKTEFFSRTASSGKSVGVVGAGPAGLACAHRLATLGHNVVIYEARSKSGGLNEYGLAAYKMLNDFAQREVDLILSIGGIEVKHGMALGKDITLEELRKRHGAVFLGVGLGGGAALGIPGEDASGVMDAVAFIDTLRQSEKYSAVPVGRQVVVIGGGMTAIDAAVQSRLLGAEEVTLVYRRGPEAMKASILEQEFAKIRGITIRYWAQPSAVVVENGQVTGIEFETTNEAAKGETFTLPADMVLKAIGQSPHVGSMGADASFALDGGRFIVNEDRMTSCEGVWAGGDCIAGGDDLTVSAVQDGKVAAKAIHLTLSSP